MRYLGWLFVFMVIIAGLGYGLVDQIGKNHWEETRTRLEAEGEPFTMDALLGDMPPEEENFARHRYFKELLEHPERAADGKALIQSLQVKQTPGLKDDRSYERRQRVWQLGAKTDISLNLVKNSPNRADGKEVLDKLSVWDVQMGEITKAARRPHSRWIGEGEKFRFNDRGHSAYQNLGMRLVQLYRLRATAHLRAEDGIAASEDIETMLRIAKHYYSESTMLSTLIGNTQCAISIQPLWEGLAAHSFSDEDLVRLSKAFASIDLDEVFRQSMRGERIYAFETIQHILEDPEVFKIDLGPLGVIGDDLGTRLALRHTPRGVFDDVLATQADFVQEHLIEGGLTLANLEALRKVEVPTDSMLPRNQILKGIRPQYSHYLERTLFVSALLENAQIAIGLERHRLKHGDYPDAIAKLAPEFLPLVPPDPITGEARIYKIKPDGTPIFYSIGLNGEDEGGLPRKKPGMGDWVWQYSVPDDLDYETYSRSKWDS